MFRRVPRERVFETLTTTDGFNKIMTTDELNTIWSQLQRGTNGAVACETFLVQKGVAKTLRGSTVISNNP